MNAQSIFANVIAARCDYQCPATQSAIDRIAAEFRDGRRGLLEIMRGQTYRDGDFNSALLSAWKDADLQRATGHGRDWWVSLQDELQKTAHRYATAVI